MDITIKNIRVPSCDGVHRLAGVLYIPKGEILGLFHVVHGMTEHIGRYEAFMRFMAAQGWLCFGYDHLGHGLTADDDSELGFIAHKRGWELLCRDVAVFAKTVKAEYGEDLPYVLMGHSMGSFIVRLAAERYIKPDKLIIMGTGGPNPAADAGLTLIALIKLIYGEKHFSKFLQNVIFGGYNNKFPDNSPQTPSAWLTNDIEIRKKYMDDKYCRFKFKVSAMGDLIRLMKYSNRPAWYKKLDTDIPILLVSGSDDPVGGFGKGVKKVHRSLLKSGHSVICHLYEGARHEILNDICRERLYTDILEFIK